MRLGVVRAMPKPRKYTGTSDGIASGKRAGTEEFVRQVVELSGGVLWNNGTWVVRQMNDQNALSVHATGRAMDLSWRKMPGKGRRNGRERALATINLLIQHANFLRIEMCLDYWPQPWGAGWRCSGWGLVPFGDRPTVR
jgi:hypothetical protein